MGLSKISLALVLVDCLIILNLIHLSQAQNTAQDYLDAHNSARAQVGVGPMRWNDTAAVQAWRYARRRAQDCSLAPSGDPEFGENVDRGTGFFTGRAAVNKWASEKGNYDYYSNSCTHGLECKHYTQVVWRKSESLGCSRVRCNNGMWYVTCNYYPPGNYAGRRPY